MARLYGVTHVCSQSTVTLGFRQALSAAGKLEGLVDLSFVPRAEEQAPGGAFSQDALYTGPLQRVSVMIQNARHERRWVLVAPNATRLPSRLKQLLERDATHLLAPSKWAAKVLQEQVQLPVVYAPHGIGPEFFPEPVQPSQASFESGNFGVLHYSTSQGQRKATRELVEAWRQVKKDLGEKAWLCLVLDDPNAILWRDLRDDPNRVLLVPRHNHRHADFRQLVSIAHLVAQPSRGEGFGLVPLEARACGCPVLMTSCTGHEDHAGDTDQGCVVVPHYYPEEEVGEGPGALAPTVEAADIAEGLLTAHHCWRELKDNALAHAAELKEEWSWEKKLSELMATIR